MYPITLLSKHIIYILCFALLMSIATIAKNKNPHDNNTKEKNSQNPINEKTQKESKTTFNLSDDIIKKAEDDADKEEAARQQKEAFRKLKNANKDNHSNEKDLSGEKQKLYVPDSPKKYSDLSSQSTPEYGTHAYSTQWTKQMLGEQPESVNSFNTVPVNRPAPNKNKQ